ncbi:hypothetical protein BSLG_001209 [Batrachochytrium salamandrivorans]|nr:hypothetical protein BSLG_001209 [Batrachochytrium salamandrivorans]
MHQQQRQLGQPQLVWQAATSTSELPFSTERIRSAPASASISLDSTGILSGGTINAPMTIANASISTPAISCIADSNSANSSTTVNPMYSNAAAVSSTPVSRNIYPSGFAPVSTTSMASAEGSEQNHSPPLNNTQNSQSSQYVAGHSSQTYRQHETASSQDRNLNMNGSAPQLNWISQISPCNDQDTWSFSMADVQSSQNSLAKSQPINSRRYSDGSPRHVDNPQAHMSNHMQYHNQNQTGVLDSGSPNSHHQSNPPSDGTSNAAAYDKGIAPSSSTYEPWAFSKAADNTSLFMYMQSAPKPQAQQTLRSTSKFYALRISRCPGIYRTWAKAKSLIDGCAGARYKSFPTISEAVDFIREQFPDATFTQNDQGEFILDDSSAVDQIVEVARAKKDKLGGIVFDSQDVEASTVGASEDAAGSLQSPTLRSWEADPRSQHLLNTEQQEAFSLATNGSNLYISGMRGVGKDTLLLQIKSHFARSGKAFAVTSACGIRSLQQDIQSTQTWMGIGKAVGTQKQILSKVRKNPITRKIWIDTDVLIIMDASSFSAHLFDVADFLGRQLRKQSDRPFGGMQVILCSDLFDLPPSLNGTISCIECGQGHKICPDPDNPIGDTAAPGAILECVNQSCGAVFQNMWTMYVFEANSWAAASMMHIELKQSYNDDTLLDGLLGDLQLLLMSQNAKHLLDTCRSKQYSDDQVFIEVVPTDQDATAINSSHLSNIANDTFPFDAQDTLLKTFDFTSRGQLRDGPTDDRLELKLGARIYIFPQATTGIPQLGQVCGFVAIDDTMREQLVSSLSFKQDAVTQSTLEWINKHRLLPQVLLYPSDDAAKEGGNVHGLEKANNQKMITVQPRIWCVKAQGRVVAWRIHLPMCLAYAVSIQKSRGLVFPSIKISPAYNWLPGQAYIALSRGASFDKLCCVDMQHKDFMPNEIVLAFKTCSPSGTVATTVTSRVQPLYTPRLSAMVANKPTAKLRSGGTKRPRLIGIPMSNSGIFPSMANDDISFCVSTESTMPDFTMGSQQNSQLPSPMLLMHNLNASAPLPIPSHNSSLGSDLQQQSQQLSPGIYQTNPSTPQRPPLLEALQQQQAGVYHTPQRSQQFCQLPLTQSFVQQQPLFNSQQLRRNSFHGPTQTIEGMVSSSVVNPSSLAMSLNPLYQQQHYSPLQQYQHHTRRRQMYQHMQIPLDTRVSTDARADLSCFNISPSIGAPPARLSGKQQPQSSIVSGQGLSTFAPDTLTKKFRPAPLPLSSVTLATSMPSHFSSADGFGFDMSDWSNSTINSSDSDPSSALGPISAATSLSEPFSHIFFEQPPSHGNAIQ